jgi:replicative DNA helicase
MPDGTFLGAVEAEDGLPPHNIDAEQAVLGAILFDNETYHRVSDFLRPEHFYEPVHGRIYAAAGAHVLRGDIADAITLAPLAEADAGLKALGGKAYLVELMTGAASTAAAVDYARFVYDLSLRRELIRVGGEIETEAKKDRQTPPRDLIESAERRLFSLAEAGSANRGFVTFRDALTKSIEMAAAAYAREGHLSGLATKLDDLDKKLGGLHRSDLIILAGRPSMGKTSLATNIAFNVARNFRQEVDPETGEKKTVDGGVVAFFSLEMSSEQLATRLLAEASEVSSHHIRRGEIDEQDFDKIKDAAREIAGCPLHIDDTGGLSIGHLAARARRLKRTVGLDLIVVDYLQLVTTSGAKKNDNRVQEVSEVTMGLKALAKELDVPVIALSQLSRQVENRDDKRPQLSDLRESGSIEQDADVVMFVYREAYYLSRQEPDKFREPDKWAEWSDKYLPIQNVAEVIIGKQRHGPIGTVELHFEDRLTKFSNLEKREHYQDMVRSSHGSGPAIAP